MLVDNAKQLWKTYSVWAMALSVFIFGLIGQWDIVAPLLSGVVSPKVLAWSGSVIGVLGLIGRFLKQTAALPNPFDEGPSTSDDGDASGKSQ